jgi:hypothetical protein
MKRIEKRECNEEKRDVRIWKKMDCRRKRRDEEEW